MDCPNCKTFYNESDHVPRLLIQCGHSICEKCSTSLYSNYTIICPECKSPNYASSLQSFPKNLALLLINKSKIKKNHTSLTNENHSNDNSGRDNNFHCQKHQKKVEAFCEKERQLLCINCILEDGHRSHEISSLQNAADKEREMSCQAFDTCNIIQEKINTAINEISETVVVLNESSERSISDLSKFYSEIRKTLDERESLLKMKIKDQLKKEENNLKLKEKSLYDHMSKIKVFYEEYEKSVNLSEISLLETCYQRQEIIFKATGQVEKLEVVLPFNELNKENELNSLFKLLGNHKHINSSKETAPIKNKVLNLNSKNMINQIPSSSCNGNTCFAKKKNLNINSVYQNHSKDLKRQNSKKNKKNENSPLKMNLNLCAERLRNKYKQTENFEDDKIPNKLTKKTSTDAYGECNTVPLNLNHLERSDKSPLKSTNLNQNITQPLKAILNYREIRDAYKEQYYGNENEILNKSSNSVTPRRSQKNIALKSTDALDSDCNNQRNYFIKKNSSKSPNLTYLSLDTSQNYEKSILTESKRKPQSEIEAFTKENFNKSHIEEKISSKNVKKEELEFLNSIMIVPRSETKESIKDSDFNTFLQGTENKTNERLDFSYIYQQFNHFIYVLGGFFDNPSNIIERFDIQSNFWEEIDTLPNSRAKFGAITLSNGNIIVIGGKQEGLRVSSIEEYVVKERRWRQYENKLTTSKSGFGTLLKNDDLYIIGGNDGGAILNIVEKYDLKEKKIKKMKPMFFSRDELAVALGTDQKFYAIGGFGGPKNSCLNSVERYDLERDEWEIIASLNIPRRALSAVTLPDGIYVMGGFDGFNYLSSVEKYDEIRNEWILVASMKSPRCTLAAVASPDFQYIYVMGGFDNVPLNTVEKYSVLTDSWELITPMKHKRFMHTAVININ